MNRATKLAGVVGALLIVAACFVLAGVRAFTLDKMADDRREEAQLLLDYVADDIAGVVGHEINAARDLAIALNGDPGKVDLFDQAANSCGSLYEGVNLMMLISPSQVLASQPTGAGAAAGTPLNELPYVFNMSRLVGEAAVEGPSDFFDDGRSLFLFFCPLFDAGGAYAGQTAVGMDASAVLSALDLERLSEAGYAYELWSIDAHSGDKVVIGASDDSFDFSEGIRTTLYVPGEWTLAIMPREGWVDARESGVVNAVVVVFGLCALAVVASLCVAGILYVRHRRSALVDTQSGLANREGFERALDKLIARGECGVGVAYLAIDDFSRVAQLAGEREQRAFLASVQRRIRSVIASPYLLGRAGEGGFLVAIQDVLSERDLMDLTRSLSMELIWKSEEGGRKSFQNVVYGAVRYPEDARDAKALVDGAVRRCYERFAAESPIRSLTRKCHQLAQGDADVEFESYADTDMMRLSEALNQYRKTVDQLVFVDQALGVGNRGKYLRDAQVMISYDRKRPFTLYCVDICAFGRYNELFGVGVGDRILRETSRCLRTIFGESLYRINGDVFLGLSRLQEDPTRMVERIRSCFRDVTVDGNRLKLEVSCGVCSYPRDGKTPSDLLECTQTALRFAKQQDADRTVVYSDELKDILRDEARVLKLLEESLEQETLEVWYQPIMDLHDGTFRSAEALLRLKDESGVYLPAASVVAMAEKNHLIERVDAFVLGRTAAFATALAGRASIERFGVNLSVQELLLEDCVDTVVKQVQRYGATPDMIALEVTETVLIESFDRVVPTLERFREMGFKVALDDFGTGYSSLNYFSTLPIDVLKIDRALVQRVLESDKQIALLKSIVDMARINGIAVIAEGVETEAEKMVIEGIGVDRIQGYYYAHPLCEDDFARLVAQPA